MNQTPRCFLSSFRARAARTLALGAVFGLGLFVGMVRNAGADDTAKPAAPAVTPDYVIGVDDVIAITAAGHEDINQIVMVLSDGKIHVNGMDEDIKAEGLTLAQLKDKVYKGLDRLYNNLVLTISLKESHSKNVTIVGGRGSGQFPLRKDMRVSSLIAQAGGLPGKTKLVVGTLIRGATKTKLDIQRIVGANPDPEADPMLQPNDIVFLDMLEEPPPPTYSVMGAVLRPASFPMPLDGTPITIARAVADAGGRTERAALSRVSLLRGGKTITLNLYPLLVEGKADATEGKMEMKNGDVLLIPELEAKYVVLGQVNRPATYPLPEAKTITVLQALAEAGGPAQNGDLRKAGVARIVGGKPTFIKINLQDQLTKPDPTKNIVLQDGDMLYVPNKGHVFAIQDILSPLWVLSAFGFRPFQ